MLNSKKNSIGLTMLLQLLNYLWEIKKPHHWTWACHNCLS